MSTRHPNPLTDNSIPQVLRRLLLVVVCGVLFVAGSTVAHAATYTWDGGGSTNDWSECANWSSNTCPTSADIAQFNSTSVKDATVDGSFGGTVLGVAVNAGYTGTITQNRNLTIGASSFVMASGTWAQGTTTFDINDGSFTLSGGTFFAAAGMSTINDDVTISDGALIASTSREFYFDDDGAFDISTLTCTGEFGARFALLKDAHAGNTFTLGAGCVATSTSLWIYSSLSINGTLTLPVATTTVYYSVTMGVAGTVISRGYPIAFEDSNGNDDGVFTCIGSFGADIAIVKDASGDFTLASGCIATTTLYITTAANTINGTLSLSTTNPDIWGPLTVTASGTLNANGRTVRFDESIGSTTIVDATGNGYNGTASGTVGTNNLPQPSTDKPNQILFTNPQSKDFDGTDDEILVSGINIANSSFTVAAWAKRESTGTEDMIFSQNPNSVTNQTLIVGFRSANQFTCAFWFNDLDTAATYTDSNWHHWACTYDAATNLRRIYRDGIIVAEGVASADYAGTGTVYLGDAPAMSADAFFDGKLDDMRLYAQALTPEEITTIYETSNDYPVAVCSTGCVDSGNNDGWNFEEIIEQILLSLSGRLFSDQGVTPITTSKTISLVVGTSTPSVYTVSSDGSGDYTIQFATTSLSTTWTSRDAAQANGWYSLTYGNGRFVAVGYIGSGSQTVMTSEDGITWSTRTAAANNTWNSVTYGNGRFVAVSEDGTNRVMYSDGGTSWTSASAAEQNSWYGVTYGNGRFVAVAINGTNRVMSSTDGVTWTPHSIDGNGWQSVTYGNGRFVAVGYPSANNKVVGYSDDGITWTTVEPSVVQDWQSVTYGNGLFVALATDGATRIMTSPDGVTWTGRTTPEANAWRSVAYGNGYFVAVACGITSSFACNTTAGNSRVMYSNNGINWTLASSSQANRWYEVAYGGGRFVAVADNGTNRVMTAEAGFGPDTPLIVYVDGDAVDATNFSMGVGQRATTTPYTPLFAGTVIVQNATSNSAVSITNLEAMSMYDSTDDADILFTYATATASTTIAGNFLVASGTVQSSPRLTTSGDFIQSSVFNDGQLLSVTGYPVEYRAGLEAAGTGTADTVYSVLRYGSFLYVAKAGNSGTCNNTTPTGCELQVYDISSSTNPVYVGGHDSNAGFGSDLFFALERSGNYLYVAQFGNGSTCNVTFRLGCELKIFDISSSSNPVYVGGLDGGAGTSAVNLYSLKVHGAVLYVGKDVDTGTCSVTTRTGCELMVFDLSSTTNPVYVGGQESAAGGGGDPVYAFEISSSSLYVAKSGNAGTCNSSTRTGCELLVFNISSTTNPVYVNGQDSTTGAGAFSFWTLELADNTLYAGKLNSAAGSCTTSDRTSCELLVFNISSTTNPVYVNGRDTAAWVYGVQRQGGILYVSKDGNTGTCTSTTLTGCELMVFDIASSTNPTYVNGQEAATSTAVAIRTLTSDGQSVYVGKQGSATTCSLSDRTGCELMVFDVTSDILGTLTGTSALGNVTVSGNARFVDNASTTNLAVSGALVAPTHLSVEGNYTQSGAYEANDGTVYLSGTSQQTATGTLSGQSAFHNLTIRNTSGNGTTSQAVVFGSAVETTGTFMMGASTSARFLANATNTFEAVRWIGATSSPVWLRSSATGTQWRFTTDEFASTTFVNVRDSFNGASSSVPCTVGCIDTGNNTNWDFGVLLQFLLSGRLYADEGVTAITSGKTIGIAIGTSTVSTYTTTSNGSGDYQLTIPGVTGIPTSTPLLVWIDGDATTRGAHFTKASSTYAASIAGVDLYRNHVIIGTEAPVSADIVVDAEMFFYDNDNDSDIPYNATFPTGVSISPGNKLYLRPTKALLQFYPLTVRGSASATSTDGSLHLPEGSIFISSASTTIGGNFYASTTASYIQLESELIFNATTTGKVIVGGSLPSGLGRVRFAGAGGGWTFTEPASTTRVTIEQGSVTNATDLSIAGNYTNSGTFINNGTVHFTGAGAVSGALTGASALDTVVVDNAASYGWVERSIDELAAWTDVAFGNGKFVAVNFQGGFALTSSDGREWTGREIPEANKWRGVTYGNGRFVAVAEDGLNQVMYSDDGITWTAASSSAQLTWSSVTYGEGLFVAVASDGANRVMTSANGVTWTTRTAAFDSTWYDVAYGNGRFVAVALDSALGTAGQVMYSDTGTSWFTATSSAGLAFVDVEYGEGLFVAVAINGSGNQVMTSPDGVTWTTRTTPVPAREYFALSYGNGTFVAIASTTNDVLYSDDGQTWYVLDNGISAATWYDLAFGEGTFVAVAADAETQIMTSQFGGEVTLVNEAAVGDLTIRVGSVLVAPTSTLTVTGSFTNGGEFDSRDGTVRLTGSGESLAGTFTGDSALGTVRIAGSYTSPANASTTNLVIESGGALTAPSQGLSLTGYFNNQGTLTSNGGTLFVDSAIENFFRFIDGESSATSSVGNGDFYAIAVSGTTLYAGKQNISGTVCTPSNRTGCELQIYDISSTTNPVYLGGQDSGSEDDINALLVSGAVLYVGRVTGNGTCSTTVRTGCELQVYDISSTTNPVFVGGEDIGTTGALVVKGNFLYVAATGGSGDLCTAIVSSGCEILIYNISSTTDPVYVGGQDSTPPTGNDVVEDLVVTGTTLYIGKRTNTGTCSVTDRTGCELQIYNISSTTNPVYVGGRETASTTAGSDNLNRLVVHNGILYVGKDADTGTCSALDRTGCELQVYNIASTTNPIYVNGVDVAEPVLAMKLRSQFLYVGKSSNSGTCSTTLLTGCELMVFDVASSTNPSFRVGHNNGSGIVPDVYAVEVASGFLYVGKQGDAATCSVSDVEGCELVVFDITGSLSGNLTGTSALGNVTVSGNARFANNASTTNLTVSGALAAPAHLSMEGNYTQSGAYDANNGTVYMSGASQQTATGTMTNASAFHNLTLKNTSGNGTTSQAVVFGAPLETTGTFTMGASTSARFLASATNTFEKVNWNGGAAGTPVWLRSSATGTQWGFQADDFVSTSYVNVRDSFNESVSTVPCTTGCTDAGNNTNWSFAAGPLSVTVLETHLADGDPATTTSDTFTPANNSLLLVAASALCAGGCVSPNGTLSGGGLTWTKQLFEENDESWSSAVWYFTAPVTAGTNMAVTFNPDPVLIDGNGGVSLVVYQITGHDLDTPVAQTFADGGIGGRSGAYSGSFGGAVASSSYVFAVTASDNDLASLSNQTPGTGWTQDYEALSGSVPYAAGLFTSRTASTSSTVSFNNLFSGYSWSVGAIEIRADDGISPTTGSLTLTSHPADQASNLFSFQNQSDGLFYRFAMTAATETAIVDDVVLSVFGLRGVDATEVTDLRLYRDVNSDGALDGGDTQVLGAGIFAIDGESGTITFSTGTTSVATTTAQHYIVTADTVAIDNNDWMNVQLRSTGVAATGLTSGSPTTITGSVSGVQHIRSNQGGGGANRSPIGGEGPAGAGQQGGGTQQGGGEAGQLPEGANIVPDPEFKGPTQTGDVFDEWTDPALAYQSDGDAAQGNGGKRQNYGGFGFAIPGSNTIQGIQVKLDASATTPAGTIQVGLSWDGGNSVTTLEATPTLSGSDVVYTLGGQSNLWGRTWTPTQFNDTNFRVRVVGQSDNNIVLLDAIEVRVYHTAGGGGAGGGQGGGAI